MKHMPKLKKSYAAMNSFGRQMIREMADGFVIDFPARKRKALPRLLVARRPRVDPLPDNTNRSVNQFPLVLIGKTVDR